MKSTAAHAERRIDPRATSGSPVASLDTADPRSLAALIKDIRDETTTLFRQEAALAQTEISEKTSRLVNNLVYFSIGALVAFAGVVVLLIAAGGAVRAALIASGWEANALWLGPLIVGVVVALIGGAMALQGKNRLQKTSLVPERTAQSLKENMQWVTSKAK